MDLILLVIGLSIVGYIVYRVPMDQIIKYVIYGLILIVMGAYLLHRYGSRVPNVMN